VEYARSVDDAKAGEEAKRDGLDALLVGPGPARVSGGLRRRRRLVATSQLREVAAVHEFGHHVQVAKVVHRHRLLFALLLPLHHRRHQVVDRQDLRPPPNVNTHDTHDTRHDTTRHNTTRHNTTRHDTTQHDTTRHDTTRNTRHEQPW
jgi:hypothetical protein